jgi:hypothetical protein
VQHCPKPHHQLERAETVLAHAMRIRGAEKDQGSIERGRQCYMKLSHLPRQCGYDR